MSVRPAWKSCEPVHGGAGRRRGQLGIEPLGGVLVELLFADARLGHRGLQELVGERRAREGRAGDLGGQQLRPVLGLGLGLGMGCVRLISQLLGACGIDRPTYTSVAGSPRASTTRGTSMRPRARSRRGCSSIWSWYGMSSGKGTYPTPPGSVWMQRHASTSIHV